MVCVISGHILTAEWMQMGSVSHWITALFSDVEVCPHSCTNLLISTFINTITLKLNGFPGQLTINGICIDLILPCVKIYCFSVQPQEVVFSGMIDALKTFWICIVIRSFKPLLKVVGDTLWPHASMQMSLQSRYNATLAWSPSHMLRKAGGTIYNTTTSQQLWRDVPDDRELHFSICL